MRHMSTIGILGTALLLLGGCGGKVVVDGEATTASSTGSTVPTPSPCAVPSTPFSSAVALTLAHCQPELPATARLLQIVSSPYGDLDDQGSSGVWRMRFHDQGSGPSWYTVKTSPLGVELDTGVDDFSCPGEDLVPFDSAIVMPDVIARFAAHDPYKGGVTNFFALQTTACLAQNGFPEGRYVHIISSDPEVPGPDGNHHWFATYSGESSFVKLCGPCNQGLGATCMPCFE